MITFVIVAHNEADHVQNVIHQARDAAADGDRLLLVDSASTDDTAARARHLGVTVVDAPLGKGAAMAAGAREVTTPWLCYLDGDLVEPRRNIPLLLRQATERAGDSVMVVGDFDDAPPQPILSNTIAVYGPLVRALIPEAADRFGGKPLTGFRTIRPELVDDDMPPDFGAETYLNLKAALSGRPWVLTHIGINRQRFRYHGTEMGRAVSRAIFDVAIAHDRLAPRQRPAWEEWVERVVSVIAGYRGQDDGRNAYLDRLMKASAAPLPSPF